ncbi:MAG: MmcQ/YjbR family DNA-binding protein [Bacteroidia bacterium]|nr:MmcQ/YjbR family DNA-binding protein [Bacteroidia bacterium]
MNIEQLRNYCIKKNGAEETFPFDTETLVFKVGGKAFLLTGIESKPVRFNVKCNPEKAIELRENYSCVLPGFHMNKKHWNTVVCDGTVGDKLIKEWIDDSYDLIVGAFTKKKMAKKTPKKKS